MSSKKQITILLICLIFLLVGGFFAYKKEKKIQEKLDHQTQIALEEEYQQRELLLESDFFQKLKNGFDTNFLVLGNSMALDEGSTSQTKWIDALVNLLENRYNVNITYKNLAEHYSGYLAGYVNLASFDTLQRYDAVILCYAPETDIIGLTQYESILRKIKEKNPHCSIISVIANSDIVENPIQISDLTSYYGGITIDMQEPFKTENDALVSHEFYPSTEGYQLYTETVFKAIEKEVSNHQPYDVENTTPIYGSSNDYEYCLYIPRSQFRYLDDKSFVIDLNNFSGKICIKAQFTAGEQAYDVYCDYGKWLTRNELSFDTNAWYYNYLLHDIQHAEHEIMISLSSDTTKNMIQGIYLISSNKIETCNG